jgi:hypothetical protein
MKSTQIDLRFMGSACRYTRLRKRKARRWRHLLPRIDTRRVG